MRKIFTLLGILLCTIAANADITYSVSIKGKDNTVYSHPDYFFTSGNDDDTETKWNYNANYPGTFAGFTTTQGLKMEGSTFIKFTPSYNSTVVIAQSSNKNPNYPVAFDGKNLDEENSEVTFTKEEKTEDGVIVYTITNVTPNEEHSVTRSISGEMGIIYVGVTEIGAEEAPFEYGPIFHWRFDGSKLETTAVDAIVGSISYVGNSSWGNSDNAGYADDVEEDMKSLTAKCLKFNNSNMAAQLNLAYPLQEGDILYICGAGDAFNIGTSKDSNNKASTNIASGLKLADDKLAMIVEAITIPKSAEGAQTVYVSRKNDTSWMTAIKIVRPAPATDPIIKTDDKVSILADVKGKEFTKEFTVEGNNLNGNTLSATLSPSVNGLSIALANDVISDGSIKTTATLTFKANESTEGTTTLKLSDGETSKEITVEYKATVDPSITADASVSILSEKSGEDVTKDFAVSGKNLEGTTLSATLEPTVEGLSVSLSDNNIVDGQITTTATITLNTEDNIQGKTTLTLSDGKTSKEVVVSYKSHVKPYEALVPISEATTWDIQNDVHGEVLFDGDDIEIERVYADIEGLTFTGSFKEESLAFKGKYPKRESSGATHAQECTLRFITTVPGTVKVSFTDTSGSKDSNNKQEERHLQINGVTTEYWVSRGNSDGSLEQKINQTSGEIAVDKGDVTISGTHGLRIAAVVFTPFKDGKLPEVEAPGHVDVMLGQMNEDGNVEFTEGEFNGEIVLESEVGDASTNVFVKISGKEYHHVVYYLFEADEATQPAGIKAKAPVQGFAVVPENGIELYQTGKLRYYAEDPITGVMSEEGAPIAVTGTGSGTSEILNIVVDNSNAPVEFFNLQGVRVDNPANGIFIRRQGNNVSKVVIR